jgi:outer membrane protein assembly factor BamB
MRKKAESLLIIAISITFIFCLSTCGQSGTSGRLGAGIEGGTPGGGLPEPIAGTLSGSVWLDYNQNQAIDPGEPGIPDIQAELYIDSNGNGILDLFPISDVSDESIATTSTDFNGNYSFEVNEAGRYFVTIDRDQPTINDLILTTNNDAPAYTPENSDGLFNLVTLIADIDSLTVGIKDINFGFFNPTKWGFDISPNGSPIEIISSAAIAPDGTIYIGSGNGALYAINPDGTIKWKYETGGALPASPAIGSDGTIYIGSMDRQFYAINPDGTLQWIYPTKNDFTSSAAIGADGTIYAAGTNRDKLIFSCTSPSSCVTTTGQECGLGFPDCPSGQICVVSSCAIPTGQPCSVNNPCPEGHTCAEGVPVAFSVTTQLGALFAINPDGTTKWIAGQYNTPIPGVLNTPLSGEVHSSPAVAPDGTIYIGSRGDVPFDRSDMCDDTSDYPTSDAWPVKPVNGHLYAFSPNGTMLWDFKTLGYVDSSPSIGADGTVYVGSQQTRKYYGENHSILLDESSETTGFVYAIYPNGTSRWVVDIFGDVDSSPAIGSDGTLYVGSDNFHVYALNPANGATIWVQPTRDEVKSSPAVASDGNIYIGSNDGSLYVFNPDGTLNTRYDRDEGPVNSSPSIGTDGTVYYATEGGFLFAVIRTSPLAITPWPKFRHDLLNTGRSN